MVTRPLTTTLEGVNETNANIVVNLLNGKKLKDTGKQMRDSGKYLRDSHRVDRVVGFLCSRPNGDPTPSPASESDPPPPLVPGGTHRLRERRWGVPIRGTDTVVL